MGLSRHRGSLLAAALLLGIGGALWAARSGTPDQEPTSEGSTVAPARGRSAPAFTPDETAAAYRLRLLDEGTVLATGAAGTRARLRLEGIVVVQDVVGAAAAAGWRALSVERVDSVSWTMGSDALPNAAARFESIQIYFRLGEHGQVDAVEAPSDLAAPVARVLRTVALALGHERLAPGETRVDAVRSAFGVATASLVADPACDRSPCSFDVAYSGPDLTELERGHGAIGDGHRRTDYRGGSVSSVACDESFRVRQRGGEPLGARDIEVRLSRVPLPRPMPPARLSANRSPVQEMQGDAARRGLEQRVGGLTVDEMLTGLRQLSGARMPDHDRWLWRATGLIQLDPAAATALAEACLDGSLTGAPRQLALELLANVGNPGAQDALRRVFSDEAFAQADDYPSALQRVALLEDPEDATIEVLAHQAESLDGAAARSAYVATGATVGHARAQDVTRGADVVQRLRTALTGARDPIDRRALVMALGNTGATEALPDLVAASSTDDAELRTIAARAMGHVETPESAARLVQMLRDPDAVVQRAAVASLARVAPDAAQLRTLAELAPELPQGTRMALIVLVARLHRDGSATNDALLPVLEAIRERGELPGDSAHQMMELYRELSGQGAR